MFAGSTQQPSCSHQMRCWNMSLNCLARSSSTCLLCPSGTTHWLMLKLLLLLLPVEAPNYSMQLQRQFTGRKTVRLCAKLFASQYAKLCRRCAAYSIYYIIFKGQENTDLMYACSQLHLHAIIPAAFDCSQFLTMACCFRGYSVP